MHPFAVSRADDVAQAMAAHAQRPAVAFIAGGTDLIGLMKDRAALPERLLDINGLPDMARIEAAAGRRPAHRRAGPHERRGGGSWRCAGAFRSLPRRCCSRASGQLRNMASIGGNIMQRTRCAYFRDEDDGRCNKRRPGSGCSALHGLNRNHAIFGWSDACVATNPSDLRSGARGPGRDRYRAGVDGRTTRSRSPIFIACRAARRSVTMCSIGAT